MPLQRSYSSKQSFQSLEEIPALVHFWKCSWAAEPESYSRGSIFHWHPVLRTYRIPLKIVRWGVGGRPPLGERTCLGTRGSTLAQNSSETSRQPGLRGNGSETGVPCRWILQGKDHLHYNQSDLLYLSYGRTLSPELWGRTGDERWYRQAKETKRGEMDDKESQCPIVALKRGNGPPDPVERRGCRVVGRGVGTTPRTPCLISVSLRNHPVV
jgi:hypothetical protein